MLDQRNVPVVRFVPNWPQLKRVCHECGSKQSINYETTQSPHKSLCNLCALALMIRRQKENLQRYGKSI